MTGAEASAIGIMRFRKDLANIVKSLGVGCRIRPRRSSDGGLIYHNDVGNQLRPSNGFESARRFLEFPLGFFYGRIEDIMHKSRFSASADSGDAGENSERNPDIQMLQIVPAGIDELNAFIVPFSSEQRNRYFEFSPKVSACQ